MEIYSWAQFSPFYRWVKSIDAIFPNPFMNKIEMNANRKNSNWKFQGCQCKRTNWRLNITCVLQYAHIGVVFGAVMYFSVSVVSILKILMHNLFAEFGWHDGMYASRDRATKKNRNRGKYRSEEMTPEIPKIHSCNKNHYFTLNDRLFCLNSTTQKVFEKLTPVFMACFFSTKRN